MKFLNALLVCSVTFLLISCSSSKSLMIDVKKPAKVNFPSNIGRLLILDNTPQCTDSVQDPIQHNICEIKKVYLSALTQFINDEMFFAKVSFDTIPLRKDDVEDNLHFLSPARIKNMLQKQEVDAIITLDMLTVEQNILPVNYGWGYFDNYGISHMTLVTSLYGKDGNKLAPTFSLNSDSIISSLNYTNPYEDPEFVRSVALEMADLTTKTILPYWQKQERMLFNVKSKNNKLAINYANAGKWTEAAIEWGKDYKNEKAGKNKSKLAANIALANEMLGDIEYAIEWIDSAIALINEENQSNYYKNLVWYKERLTERSKDLPLLKQQFAGE